MNWFKDLKVFQKIMLILVVYAIALVINLFIGRASLLETQGYLVDLEERIYDSVQLAAVNRPLLKRADELLTQAVSFGEADLKNQGKATISLLQQNLGKLQDIDQIRRDALATISENVRQYESVAVPIVEEMLGGELDYASLQARTARKAELFESVNKGLDAYYETMNSVFKKTIQNAVKSGESSLFLTSAVNTVFFVVLAFIIVYVARSISKTASQLRDSLSELAKGSGNLDHRIRVSSKDELGLTADNFNQFMEKLSDIVRQIFRTSNPLLEAANDLDSNAKIVEKATNELLAKASEGKSAMSEITLSISEISQSATQASDAMQETDQKATQGLDAVNHTIDNSENLNGQIVEASEMVERLAQDTDNVANILDVISTIAEQTNLLALNAAIEAARAGEQGRGFAVVADEVRALASKTADATTEIRDVLGRLEDNATATVDAMVAAKEQSQITRAQTVETGEALKQIKTRIEDVKQMNLTIAAATEEQSVVVNNVSEIIANMYDSVQTTESSFGELASLAEKLLSASDSLKVATSQFRVESSERCIAKCPGARVL